MRPAASDASRQSSVVIATAVVKGGPAAAFELYPRLLGAAWQMLHPNVQCAHSSGTTILGYGTFRIERGAGALARLALLGSRLPSPSESVTATVEVQRRGHIEWWHRTLGDTPLVTLQRAGAAGGLVERFGALELTFRLTVVDGSLTYSQVGCTLRLGSRRIPVPGWLAPRVSAREDPANAPRSTNVTVEVAAPLAGPLFSYRGTIRWEGAP